MLNRIPTRPCCVCGALTSAIQFVGGNACGEEHFNAWRKVGWPEQFLCTPAPTERDLQLDALARRYHEETEAYDRKVCTGPVIGGAVQPRDSHELGLITRNAIATHARLVAEAEAAGFTRIELRRAIGRASR